MLSKGNAFVVGLLSLGALVPLIFAMKVTATLVEHPTIAYISRTRKEVIAIYSISTGSGCLTSLILSVQLKSSKPTS